MFTRIFNKLNHAAVECDWSAWEMYELALIDEASVEFEAEFADYPAFLHTLLRKAPKDYQRYIDIRDRMMRCGGVSRGLAPEYWEERSGFVAKEKKRKIVGKTGLGTVLPYPNELVDLYMESPGSKQHDDKYILISRYVRSLPLKAEPASGTSFYTGKRMPEDWRQAMDLLLRASRNATKRGEYEEADAFEAIANYMTYP